MVLPRLALATAAVVAAATAVHVGTATAPTAALPAGLAVSARPAPKSVPELYELHCAQCHGEKGDGNGVTELERPARSFVEGGYIYGNTIAAVTRTLNRGIPGSAMPSFADSLTEHERGLLARHVLSLGPESTDASPAECLVPTPDRPEVLDGPLMIPGLPASAPVGDVGLHPSRLMIFPGGPSVQFARGNWDLIAIRAQGPVSRDDWRRGGRSITARGEVLWRRTAPDAVDPGSLVNLEGGMHASKRLQRTQMDGRSITQVFRVGSPDGSARLSERVRPVTFGDDAVIVRVLELTGDEAVTFAPLSRSAEGSPEGPAGRDAAEDAARSRQTAGPRADNGWWAVDGPDDLRQRVIVYHRGAPAAYEEIVRAALERDE